MVVAWLGCNAILGNESAVFTPEGNDAAVDVDASRNAPSPQDGSVTDGALVSDDAGPCVDTNVNPRHCGECLHDCLGGECVSGMCQPIELATDDGVPGAIAVDATHVYWTNQTTGDVKRVTLAAEHAVETIFQGSGSSGPVKRFALHGGKIYFPYSPDSDGSLHAVFSCPITGCGVTSPTKVVGDLEGPGAVDVVGDTLIVTELTGGKVGQCALPCGSGLTPIANEALPVDVAKEGTTVVWIVLNGDVRVKLDGTAPFSARKNTAAASVALVGGEIVYADQGSGIGAMQLDGGAFRYISRTHSPSLAVDSSSVYFTDFLTTGGVYRCPLSGCADASTPIAQNQSLPNAVAFDDKSVVWINMGSAPSIRRVAR